MNTERQGHSAPDTTHSVFRGGPSVSQAEKCCYCLFEGHVDLESHYLHLDNISSIHSGNVYLARQEGDEITSTRQVEQMFWLLACIA